jgi:hypothetical protein
MREMTSTVASRSDFRKDLKAALVEHLNRDWDGGAYGSITAGDIVDISVRWDDGDRYDPTYGDSPNAAPTFEVQVILSEARGGDRVIVDTAWTFTALLRAVLEIGDR